MPDASAITKNEYEVLAEFRYALRRFMSFSENAAKAEDDRRKVFISMTGRGLANLGRLSQIHREELQRLTPQLRLLLKRINKLSEESS
jgi:hypothetical protein